MTFRLSTLRVALLLLTLIGSSVLILLVCLLGDPPLKFKVIMILLSGAMWWAYLSIPYEVTATDDGYVRFRSLRGSAFSIAALDILSIDAPPWYVLWSRVVVRIKHKHGTVFLLHEPRSLCAFATVVSTKNPSVVVSGLAEVV